MNDRRTAITTAITSFIALSILGAYLYRPDLMFWNSIPYEFRGGFPSLITMMGVMLFWLPMISILLILRESPEKFGFSVGDYKSWRWWSLGMFAAVLPILIFAARRPEFQHNYPYYCPQAAESGLGMLYYELSQGFYFFIWEFFFRGFLLFGLARAFGKWSIPIGAVLFMMFHYGKPQLEFYASLPTGLILGWVALRSKSFLPAFIVHWAAAASFDLLVLNFSGKL